MSVDKTSLLALAEGLVSYGKKSGASQVEVTVSEGTEFSARVREGAIEKLTEAGSRSLSLRLFVDQKAATASSSDLSKDTLERLVDNAVRRARLSGADSFAGLPEPEKVAVQAESLGLFDPAIPALPPEKKIGYAKETERIALADKRVKKSTGAGFGSYVETVYLASSNGFSGSYSRTSCSCSVGLQAGEGDNLFQEGWWDQSLRIGDLMPAEAIAQKAIQRVTRLIGARKVESQNVPVVLEPPMTGALLGFLATCVDGEGVNQGQSFLAGRLGEKIGSDLVTVLDDGLLPGGLGTSPFDAEGVPCRKTAILDRGVFRSYVLDTYNARKLKMRSTGNAGGTTNFYLAAGPTAPEEILKSVEKGLLLTSTMGQGIVPTTGDLSRGAFGLWIEKGEIAFPVAEITISGNLGQILKNVVMVGNDLKFRRATTGPTIKIAEMTVGGK